MPLPLALAVAEVESNFDMEAVGAVGEVGVMQLNPGPENTYWINLQAETNQDPTTPAGNIVCGVYLLGTHLINYEDTERPLWPTTWGRPGRSKRGGRCHLHGVHRKGHGGREPLGGGAGLKPFNFNEGSREQTRREAVARARFHRWQAPGRSRVVHPAHGSIVVPHASNLAAILNAAEVWRCDWATILDAEVWAADQAEPVAKMPIHIK